MLHIILMVIPVIFISHTSLASVTLFLNNKPQWTNQVGAYTTVDFTGWPTGTIINYQYQHLGVSFTDGFDWIHNATGFLNDGSGLVGGGGAGMPETITIEFATPINYMGYDFPGLNKLELYSQGTLFYTSPWLTGHSGYGHFAGVISSVAFDKARIFNLLSGAANIDDLFFQPIPAPGALALLGLAALGGPGARRRRRDCCD